MAQQLYTRLTRNAAGIASYSSLWLAEDHVMLVRSTGYSESYSRIQLRDIKAIFLTRSDRRLGWGVFWGGIVGVSAVVAVVTLLGGAAPWISGTVLALSLAAFVANILLGPGCRAYVVTGVQTAQLPALVRMKQARRVLAKLQPLIEAAQADLAAAPAAASAPAEAPRASTE